MPYYLAMDVGGTRTTYVLADGTRILARTESGTVKRLRTTPEIASINLHGALREIEALSGVPLHEVQCVCAGVAGITIPLVTDWLRDALRQQVGGELLLLGDVEIALDAVFPGQPGILVLAGTGSNVAGRTMNGHVTTAGGYGPVLSDQGSGHRIGSQALRAVFLAIDEGKENLMLASILDFWKLDSAGDLVSYANTCPASELSSLTPVVLRCAQAGDALALRVLENEGEDLAYLALLIHSRLLQADGAAWQPKVAFAGSILQHVHPVRDALLRALRRDLPGIAAAPDIADPVLGALWRARRSKSRRGE